MKWFRNKKQLPLISAEEFNQCMLETHSIIKKLVAFYDKNPQTRDYIERHLGSSMEYVVGNIEDMMRMIDKNKDEINKDPVRRKMMSQYILELGGKLQKMVEEIDKHKRNTTV